MIRSKYIIGPIIFSNSIYWLRCSCFHNFNGRSGLRRKGSKHAQCTLIKFGSLRNCIGGSIDKIPYHRAFPKIQLNRRDKQKQEWLFKIVEVKLEAFQNTCTRN